ncbi:hypothetical protein Tco_0412750 [Tanacetum coccineum]
MGNLLIKPATEVRLPSAFIIRGQPSSFLKIDMAAYGWKVRASPRRDSLPGHGSTSSVGRKSNAIFALPGHGSTSSVGRKSNAIFALPGHGSTSSVGRKSNAIFALPGHESTSSVGLYYTGSAFIIWRRMVGKCARLRDGKSSPFSLVTAATATLTRLGGHDDVYRRVDPGAPTSCPLLTGSSLLAALFKAREDDERHQESRQDQPNQIMLQPSSHDIRTRRYIPE